jgi:hypothetical protein
LQCLVRSKKWVSDLFREEHSNDGIDRFLDDWGVPPAVFQLALALRVFAAV